MLQGNQNFSYQLTYTEDLKFSNAENQIPTEIKVISYVSVS